MNHYVYVLRSVGHSRPLHYVGMRSCQCPVENDAYLGSGNALRDALGAGVKFEKTIICVCDSREEAAEMEAALVTEEALREPGCLNLQTGGKASIIPGDRSRERMRTAKLGSRMPLDQAQRISKSLRGRSLSEEHKKNVSMAKTGKPHRWRRSGPMPEETRKNISQAVKQAWERRRTCREF